MKISTSMNSYAKYLCVMLTLVTHVLLGQNYVISRSFKNGVATEANDVSKTTTQIQYLDGLGRPIQSIAVGQSPTGKDVITHQAYDAFGREPNQFLPFTDTNTGATGAFRTNAATLQNTFYSSNIPQLAAGDLGRPFQETTFEASPLNRVVNQRTPGNKSNNSTIEYLVNKGTSGLLAVKRYDFQENAVLTQTVTYVAYYPDNQLTIVKITDEEGKIMLEAKDKEGQTILKRALVDESTYADTYYVYDDLSRLRAVLQPNYQTEANATKYAFLYRYDTRGRLVEKQVPGAESVEMRYDQYDRLVLSRDGNQRVNSKWSFTKYDAFNRVIMTGEISNSLAPTQTELLSNGHHESLTGAGEVKYSLNGTLPSTISESHVLTVTYYDDYNSWGALSYTNPYSIANETNLKGYLTGGRSRVIESNNTYSSFLVNTIYYDGNYRVIQTCKELYGFSSGERVTRTSFKYKYALANVVEREQQEQEAETQIGKVKTEKTYSYDHADRLMGVQHQLSVSGVARPEVGLSSMGYNELGQLSTKWLHSLDGTNYRRKQGYTYNIRGWQAEHQVKYKTEGVSGEQTQFSYGLNYETGSSKYTNGNISSMSWTHGVMDSYPVVNGSYSFTYDGLNRLKSTGISAENNEGGIDYDANGNIKLLKRWKAGVLIDDLVYNYSNGNRLNGIVDNSLNPDGFKEAPGGGLSSYAYDANGNLTQDLNKEILANKLNYNLLNLVRYVELGTTVVNKLKYVYDATGEKLRFDYEHGTDASKNETSRYVGSVEYSSNGLKRIGTGEGQIVFGSATVGVGVESYEYYLTDHLGNTREVVTSQGQLLQRTDYYGFGLPIALTPSNVDASRKVNKYLYNGKELQPETNLLDYGARQYDPAAGRWFTIDPLLEKFISHTPYNYCLGNPVVLTDPDGMKAIWNRRYGEEAGYYDNLTGESQSWDEVQTEYRIGNASSSYSVVLSAKKEMFNNGVWDKNRALENLLYYAEQASIKNTSLRVLQVNDSEDAANQIEGLSAKVSGLMIMSHGFYKAAEFKIGAEKFNNSSQIKNSKSLSRIASFLTIDSEIVIYACHIGSYYNGGVDLLKSMASKMKRNVYGNQSWGKSTDIFSGSNPSFGRSEVPLGYTKRMLETQYEYPASQRGVWTKASYNNGIINAQSIWNVFFDSFGKIRYEK